MQRNMTWTGAIGQMLLRAKSYPPCVLYLHTSDPHILVDGAVENENNLILCLFLCVIDM